MFKVTLKFCFLLLMSCRQPDRSGEMEAFSRQLNTATEARIDSLYNQVKQHCDSLVQFQVPVIADSLSKIQRQQP